MPLLQSLKPKVEPAAARPAALPSKSKMRKRARMSADLLFNRPWCIRRERLESMVAEYMNGVAAYGDDDDDIDNPEDYPYSMTADGIACIPVDGPLTAAPYWRGTSYPELCEMAAHAYANSQVNAVLFCYDSPGGTASGMNECADYLFGLRDQKPTAAIADDQCYSAAYCLASTSPRLFVNRYTGGVGSIGAWTAHVDLSEMDKQMGVKVTYVFAGAQKVDGNPHEPLSDRAEASMQAECDACRDNFVASVAKSRGVSADDLYDTEAGIYMRADGIPLLADEVGTMDDALNYLRGQVAAKAAAATQQQDGQSSNLLVAALAAAKINAEKLSAALEAAQGGINAGAIPPHKTATSDSAWDGLTNAENRAAGHANLQGLFQQMASAGNGGWCDAVECLPAGPKNGYAEYEPGPILSLRAASQRASIVSGSSGRLIRCCVAPYNQLSADLGGFKEIYSPGCFKESLAAGDDARALFNHDPNFVLGRRSADTVRFFEQADGLYFEAEAPNTSWADDLLVSMGRGDIDGGSAAFFILQPRWEYRDGGKVRYIDKARLVEASVASFPIYESTKATVVQPAATAADTAIAETAVNDLDRARLELLRLR